MRQKLNRAFSFELDNENSGTRILKSNTYLQKFLFELATFKEAIFIVLHSQSLKINT